MAAASSGPYASSVQKKLAKRQHAKQMRKWARLDPEGAPKHGRCYKGWVD